MIFRKGNMAEIPVTINGKQVTGRSEMTILDLAKENGIDIPTLCYLEGLTPTGACRVCVVEVEGSRTLVASCHTPISKGMVIQTHSPRVLETRKLIVELLTANHCGSCFLCEKANVCELRKIAADLGVGIPRFQPVKKLRQIESVNPYIERDLSKCIVCRRCVRACAELANKSLLDVGYRGSESKIVYDTDKELDSEACKDCGICISKCPTGALSTPRKLGKQKNAKPLLIKG
jgi:NADH dehydrogenase/NADH:ubiquinone oxidoreductase subunit G